MRLDDIPRFRLTHLPTPLEAAPRLAEKLGLRKLLIKRDDCTTLAMGGNKARKLEFLIAEAMENGADVVLTDGGPQSNHARMTAAACRRAGIDRCILFLGGPRFDRFYGNLLLDVVLGAEIRFMEDATVKDMENAMAEEAENLRMEGSIPYVIPIGGSTPLGEVGYVMAMRELAEQLSEDDKAPIIFTAVGSAGTLAGCTLGARIFLPDAQVIGISVASGTRTIKQLASAHATATANLIGADYAFGPDDITAYDDYRGEMYGVPSDAGNNAILKAAQTEALILDPVYTGKAMSGLIDLAQTGCIDSDRTVIFIHTGGAPGLLAFEDQFRTQAKFEVAQRKENE